MDGFTLTQLALHCTTAAKLFSTTYIREPRKGGGNKGPMAERFEYVQERTLGTRFGFSTMASAVAE